MSFTTDQLDRISAYVIPTHLKKKPIDQITKDRPLLKWLLEHKEEWDGMGGYVTEPLRVKNDGNGQDYWGADQVSYNSRDPLKRTNWKWANYHQGFGFDEDTLKANGITISDDSSAVASTDEKRRLNNLYAESVESMRLSTEEDLDLRMHLDGSQSPKAAPGLDFLVSLTPNVGTIGGLNAADFPFWRNNTALDIDVATPADGAINAALKRMWRANVLHGKKRPDGVFVGQRFIERLEAENRAIHHVNVQASGKSATNFDGAVGDTRFNALPVIHDPTFEELDTLFGPLATPWTDRAYLLNSETLRLRPLAGEWMRQRKPKRAYDRYVHYSANTTKYAFTVGQRNAQAVLSIDADTIP